VEQDFYNNNHNDLMETSAEAEKRGIE